MHDTYFDELFFLVDKINKRKIQDYKIQMAIIQNPHVKDPKVLWKEIEKQENELEGKSYLEAEFDTVGFEMLKSKMRENPRIVVK